MEKQIQIAYYTNSKDLHDEHNTVAEVDDSFTWSREVRESIERKGYYRDSWGIVWSQASRISNV